jgi:hypothetical protein
MQESDIELEDSKDSEYDENEDSDSDHVETPILEISEVSQPIGDAALTGFSSDLLLLKNSYLKQLNFGDIYHYTDFLNSVHQFAWRDSKAVVLFALTIYDGKSTIEKLRKRPA